MTQTHAEIEKEEESMPRIIKAIGEFLRIQTWQEAMPPRRVMEMELCMSRIGNII